MFQVLVSTSVGDIDIELWSKEAPNASRNFVQLCLEGYYDNTIFHRIVKGEAQLKKFIIYKYYNMLCI
jgi:peptidyl-prolyl cis-trans isomerase SDCCAG10